MAIIVNARSRWRTLAVLASAALSITAAFSLCRWRKKVTMLQIRIQELESSFHTAVKNCSAERKGRIRAQQVEAVDGRMLLLSGVDLVDGTPVLDIKPYLPYCDNVQGAKVPDWIMADGVDDPLAVASVIFSPDFSISLASCWEAQGKHSLYPSPDEFQILIEQILSRDVRSLSQRLRPHKSTFGNSNLDIYEHSGNWTYISQDNCMDEDSYSTAITSVATNDRESLSHSDKDIVEYHIIVEGLDVSYTIDDHANVVIHQAALTNDVRNDSVHECNHTIWSNVVGKLPNHVA